MPATGTYQMIDERPVVRFERTFPHPVEAAWQAVTEPSELAQWFPTRVEFEALRPGARINFRFEGDRYPPMTGEVLEVDPPRRLVQSWRMLFEESQAAEPLTRITWEIEQMEGDVTRLTVVHELEGAPIHLALVTGDVVQGGGGWPFILSDLKSLLETGAAMGDTA
jgi:uncharacterized protein YndB with AHSA1/START domain